MVRFGLAGHQTLLFAPAILMSDNGSGMSYVEMQALLRISLYGNTCWSYGASSFAHGYGWAPTWPPSRKSNDVFEQLGERICLGRRMCPSLWSPKMCVMHFAGPGWWLNIPIYRRCVKPSLRQGKDLFCGQFCQERTQPIVWQGSYFRLACVETGSWPASPKVWMEWAAKACRLQPDQNGHASAPQSPPMRTMPTFEYAIPRGRQRKARVRVHVGFCTLWLVLHGHCSSSLQTSHHAWRPARIVGSRPPYRWSTARMAAVRSGYRKTACLSDRLDEIFWGFLPAWSLLQHVFPAAVFCICLASFHMLAFQGVRLSLALRQLLATCHLFSASQEARHFVWPSLSTCMSRSGPNSGRGSCHMRIESSRLFQTALLLMTILCIMPAASGVRVAAPPMQLAEAAPTRSVHFPALAAKQHGYREAVMPSGQSAAMKRSFKRACRRAQQHPARGTYYKGRWCSARALGVRSGEACSSPVHIPARSAPSLRPTKPSPLLAQIAYDVLELWWP